MSDAKNITLTQLAVQVVNTDNFNGQLMALDVIHVLEIALKRCIGFNVMLDGSMGINLGNGQVLNFFLGLKPNSKNLILELCDLAKPHLIEGQRLFASKSVVVAVNDSQSLADRLADIELTIRLLAVLASKLKEQAS